MVSPLSWMAIMSCLVLPAKPSLLLSFPSSHYEMEKQIKNL